MDWTAEAREIMRKCKASDPMFYGDARCDQMAPQWGRIFAASKQSVKALHYGVDHYYMNDTTGDRPTPGQIIHHAKLNRMEWLNTPAGRRWAENKRKEKEDERDRALAEGTWKAKGYYGQD